MELNYGKMRLKQINTKNEIENIKTAVPPHMILNTISFLSRIGEYNIGIILEKWGHEKSKSKDDNGE